MNENKCGKCKIKQSKSNIIDKKKLNSQYELNIKIGMLNLQGLTKEKAVEITNLLNCKENDITMLGLIETHEKYSKINWNDGIIHINQMREMDDKKGGGISFLSTLNDKYNYVQTKKENNCRDILQIAIKINDFEFFLFIIYVDIKEESRNISLYKELDKLANENLDRPILIMGDFNGHVGFLGHQPKNKNGKILLDFIEKWNLTVSNSDPNWIGLYTREQNDNRSVIDYVLMNKEMYQIFNYMHIDEDKLLFDLSDHCLLEVFLLIEQQNNIYSKNNSYMIKEYCKVNDEELLDLYVENVSKILIELEKNEQVDIEKFEKVMKDEANRLLKKNIKFKIDNEE